MRVHEPRRRGCATVALALLAALATAGCQDQAPVTTPTATVDPTTPPASYDLLQDATAGGPPTIPYLRGRTLVRPDGEELELDRRYDQLIDLDERLVAAYDDRGERKVDLLDATGEVVRTHPLEADLVADTVGGLVAWATPAGELRLVWAGGGLSLGNQGGPVTARAVVGDAPCSRGSDECRVYVDNRDDRPPQWVAPDGSVGTPAPGAVSLEDVHRTGLVAVQLSSSDTGSCSGVLDEQGRQLWRTCDHSLSRFSDDGGLVLGSDPYLDGLGLPSVSVLDARTGELAATFTVTGGFVAQLGWQDDQHPVVVLSGPDGWEVLRLGLDGTRERLLGPLEADRDPTRPVVVLAGRR